MVDRFNPRKVMVALAILMILNVVASASAFEIGGFDASRGGLGSFSEATGLTSPEDLRLAVQANFPDVIISGTPELTVEYLSGVQVLFLTVWWSSSQGVSPLSPAEQSALYDFVVGGGSALIFVDNHDLDDVSHESMIDPFGLDVTGKINAYNVVGTFSDPASCPATMGPFGTLTHYNVEVPGWFDVVGPHAVALDVLPNGEPSLAYIDFGVLGPDSGAVLLCSDSSLLVGLYLLQETVDLVSNMIAACIDHMTDVPGEDVPSRKALLGAVPNPFNPSTKLSYETDRTDLVRLKVFDAAGRLVRTLVDGRREAGRHDEVWDGRDDAGRLSPAGVYLYRFTAGSFIETRRMVLVK